MYIPPRRPRLVPSGAIEKPAANASAHADPRDGATPPPLPTDSPANPLALARVISGDPRLQAAQIPQVLGASVAQLIRDKSSVLYVGTKASGAPTADGKASSTLSSYAPPDSAVSKAPTKTKPSKTTPQPPDDIRSAVRAWVLARLTAAGATCPRWTAASESDRLAAVNRVFYGARPAQSGGDPSMWSYLPSDPREIVHFVNETCGVPPPPPTPYALASPNTQESRAAAWFAQVRAAGVTCDQWIAASETQRYGMIQSLVVAGRVDDYGLGAPTVAYWFNQECLRTIEPAATDPAVSIRARLRAILDCGALDAQDKLQQIAVIQRVFPEFARDQGALYRLALARYDLCNSPPQNGWTGGSSPAPIPERQLGRMAAQGWADPLDGDIRGMSGVQWVRQGPYMTSGVPDLFDAVQGATGDCYLIAALASLAWTMPGTLAAMGTPVGNGQRRFLLGDATVTVSERVATVILAGFQPLFASSPRLDHQWAGVIEKAYAAWRTSDTTDRPRVTAIQGSGGGPQTGTHTYGPSVSARWTQASPIADLIGGREFWYDVRRRSDNEMFATMQGFCTTDGRIQSPTVACTRPSGAVDATGLVPSHVYSILGVGVRPDGRRFYALRNPWGFVPEIAAPYQFMLPSRFLGRLNLNSGEGGCFAVAHDTFSSTFDLILGSTSTRYQ